MILDEVLYESKSFDIDDMVDIFTEGFLFALEMQEAGYKAGSTEELSESIAEAANIAISELSDALKSHARDVANAKADYYDAVAQSHNRIKYANASKYGKYSRQVVKSVKNACDSAAKSAKYEAQAARINTKIKDKKYK